MELELYIVHQEDAMGLFTRSKYSEIVIIQLYINLIAELVEAHGNPLVREKIDYLKEIGETWCYWSDGNGVSGVYPASELVESYEMLFEQFDKEVYNFSDMFGAKKKHADELGIDIFDLFQTEARKFFNESLEIILSAKPARSEDEAKILALHGKHPNEQSHTQGTVMHAQRMYHTHVTVH